MGINNFCKLIQPILRPTSKPTFFDSVLVDCQSFLYGAIEHCLEIEQEQIFDEICESVWEQINNLLKTFLSHSDKYLTFILSFDGEGVPMKWATQRERRRRSKNSSSKKNFYRYILFGNNKLSIQVQNYVIKQLKKFNHHIRVIVCGCNVPGEGEHKIFQIAESLKTCQNPVVVSVDQDVFILSFLRLDRYQTLQIYRYNQFYNINNFVSKQLSYPLKRLITVSFLFGNDFIPTLIGITATNPPNIHNCLSSIDEDDDPPTILSLFIQNMQNHIHFTLVEFVDNNLIIWFWTTYFWILDYYTLRNFPQLFLENHVYDAFDRNQLLTGLINKKFSKEMFQIAQKNYKGLITQPIPNAERYVFMDSEDLVKKLQSFWTESKDQFCTVIRITNVNRKKSIL